MNQIIYRLAGLLLLTTGMVQATVNLDQTRLVFEGDMRSASMMAINSQNKPYLLQSWVENDEGEKIVGPLLAIPPLQRIEPQQKTVLQIATIGVESTLPKDQESLFYLNVLAVPPKSERDNVLQIAFQSRIKIFYRPKGLAKPTPKPWQAQMAISVAGQTLRFENPTAYHVVIASLGEQDETSFPEFSELILKPFSRTEYVVPRAQPKVLYLRYMDDFGGAKLLTYDCGQAPCQLTTPKEERQ